MMPEPPSRVVSLVLVDPLGTLVGRLPAFAVTTPWWQDMVPLVGGCLERFGIRPTVLRLLSTERGIYPGGGVTYLAEIGTPEVAAIARFVEPWPGALDEQPLRMPWARAGGPAADLAWADEALVAAGRRRTGHAEQMRTWNLSSVWRLPTTDGPAWLKVVPPFFAHEGAVLDRLAGGPVPILLARDGGRVLMADVLGDDRYDATGAELLRMVDGLVGIQVAWAGRTAELLALGMPDWRGSILSALIADVVERTADQLSVGERLTLDGFLAGLPARLDAVETCGLPDTLVHGDFAPGNVRGDGTAEPMTLLDWGDSTVGQPLLDLPAFLDRTPAGEAAAIRAHWEACWRNAVPGSDPTRTARLLAPVAAARQAVVYRRFLDQIEPAERVYHAGDPADWLRRTVALLDGKRQHGLSDRIGTA
jgi:Ser/Thr protein kinase RdoA (MazF antagonist)